MTTSNKPLEAETALPILPLTTLMGTIYGATWAPLLLILFSASGADGAGQLWLESTVARATIGLWFGAIGGGLAGLIGGAAYTGTDIDKEPWSVLLQLAGTSLLSTAAIILLYTRLLSGLTAWLATTQLAHVHGVAYGAIVLCLGLLLPTLGAIHLLKQGQQGNAGSKEGQP